MVEINTNIYVNGKEMFAPRGLRPWHVRHFDYTGTREALRVSHNESIPDNRRGRKGNAARESDNFVVPMKAGNAAGGKDVTCGSAL